MSDETVRLKEALRLEQLRRFESEARIADIEESASSARAELLDMKKTIQRLKDENRALRRHRVHK